MPGLGSLVFFWKKKDKATASLDEHALRQRELDKKLVYSLNRSRFPSLRQMKYLRRYLGQTEKRLLDASVFLLVASVLFVGVRFYLKHLETMPVAGGEYREALIGAPRYINPLYAGMNDVDNDIAGLVYSSLFKRNKDGQLEKDLVADFFVSDDNKTYEFSLRNDARWHNGSPVTANDVYFTFNAITNPVYKSNLRQSLLGARIEVIDDHNFRIILNAPYAAFLDLLGFGIMPADLWSEIAPENANLAALNLKPIGSGPYVFDAIIKDSSGNIKEYKLERNEDYYGQKPYLSLSFKFYSGFDGALAALNDNSVDGISYLPAELRDSLLAPKSLSLHKLRFPQITMVFLNQKQNPALAEKPVRHALAQAIDRRAIVNDVLAAEASLIEGPIQENSFAYFSDIKKYAFDPKMANDLLENSGWKGVEINAEVLAKAEADLAGADEKLKAQAALTLAMGQGRWRQKNGQYLRIKLATVERKENEEIIAAIARYWEAVGVKVETRIMSAEEIQTEVLVGRDYEALFYAQVLGSDPDPYAFWHSSQTEKGYNIALYANKEVDKLLEDARLNPLPEVRKEKYKRFQEIIVDEEPVIFMYSPTYTYAQKNSVQGFAVDHILIPRDRFANVADWYMETGKRLKFEN